LTHAIRCKLSSEQGLSDKPFLRAANHGGSRALLHLPLNPCFTVTSMRTVTLQRRSTCSRRDVCTYFGLRCLVNIHWNVSCEMKLEKRININACRLVLRVNPLHGFIHVYETQRWSCRPHIQGKGTDSSNNITPILTKIVSHRPYNGHFRLLEAVLMDPVNIPLVGNRELLSTSFETRQL